MDFHAEPAAALNAGHHPNIELAGLQNRALFDMRLDIGMRRWALDHTQRAAGDIGLKGHMLGQGIAEAHALGVLNRIPGFRPGETGIGHGAHAARGETAALLIGPGHDLDRAAGGDAGLAQGLHRLQPGNHAVNTVEAATLGLAVHMAAGQDGRQAWLGALMPEEQIAQPVDTGAQPQSLTPGDEHAARFAVQRRQAGAVHPIARNGAQLGHRHQPVPLPRLAHRRHEVGRHHIRHLSPCSCQCDGFAGRGIWRARLPVRGLCPPTPPAKGRKAL